MVLYIKNNFKSSLLLFLILFSSQNLAASVNDAVNASKNDNSIEAVKLWSQLAGTGNTIAKYNLASYYTSGNGVQKNKQVADKWLKDATRSGLIQAYLNLNKKAIAPAKGITINLNVNPELWLDNQEPNKYTIQLASSRNVKSIKKTYNDNNIEGKGGYYHYVRDGIDRYGLIYGTYKTVAAANMAMKKLPDILRKKTPWVRKISSIQNISK